MQIRCTHFLASTPGRPNLQYPEVASSLCIGCDVLPSAVIQTFWYVEAVGWFSVLVSTTTHHDCGIKGVTY